MENFTFKTFHFWLVLCGFFFGVHEKLRHYCTLAKTKEEDRMNNNVK